MPSVGIGYTGFQAPKTEFFKLPFNELLAGLSAKQKQYDEGVADTGALSKLFGEAGVSTQHLLENVKQKYNPEIEALTNKLAETGEYNPYEVQKLTNRILNDPERKIYEYDYKLRDKVLETQASQEFPDAYMTGYNKQTNTWNPYTGKDVAGLASINCIKPLAPLGLTAYGLPEDSVLIILLRSCGVIIAPAELPLVCGATENFLYCWKYSF